MKTLSIVIPTYKSWDEIRRNFCHLTGLGSELEVIIVDNVLKKTIPSGLPSCFTIIHEPIPGSYAARNAGIKKAAGRCVFFTDADCYIPVSTIRLLIDLSRETSLVCSGPTRIQTNEIKSIITLYDKLFAFDYDAMKKSNTAITANLLVPKFYFDSVGMFNSNTYSGGDVEWTKKYSASHKICYINDLIILHPPRKSLSELATKARRTVGGRWQTLNFIKTVSLVLSPPIRRIMKICRSDCSLWVSSRLIILLIYLKAVEFIELISLMLGGKRERL